MSTEFHLILGFLLLVGVICIKDATGHECYVCGPKANLSCDGFDPANKSFVQDCPSARGCSIQTDAGDNVLERSCEEYRLGDCQPANKILYCYCFETLCNAKPLELPDDEDLAEGSGTSVIPTNTMPKEPKVASRAGRFRGFYFSTYRFILALLCL